MRIPLKLFIAFTTLSLSLNGYAFPELPFCPAGGPTGWLNYFNYKRDQDNWRRYSWLSPSAYNTVSYPGYYAPAFPYANRRYDYAMPPAHPFPPYRAR